MPPIRVFKFGGTSVGSADAVRAAAEITKRFAPGLAVVVSASSGTTDVLLSAARAALASEQGIAATGLEEALARKEKGEALDEERRSRFALAGVSR